MIEDLIGKNVTVSTIETTYSGKLVEIGDEYVHLESELGWIVIPVSKVTNVMEKLTE
ncbi:MAG: hypothetical protein NC929_05110 [Candidatus Omnitrophica bacterium]|nr:hypothetical protein [Candidatus Omnitrophota bacterium]